MNLCCSGTAHGTKLGRWGSSAETGLPPRAANLLPEVPRPAPPEERPPAPPPRLMLNRKAPPPPPPAEPSSSSDYSDYSDDDDTSDTESDGEFGQRRLQNELKARLQHKSGQITVPEQSPGGTVQEEEPKNDFYTDEGMMTRIELLEHPVVKAALEDLWDAANCLDPGDEKVDKQEYAIMHRKIVLSLQPMATPKEAMEAMEEDWIRDAMGEDGLTRERFILCWFELADLWTETMEAVEYEEFLRDTMELIVKRNDDGTVQWQNDRDVIRLHFKRRQEQHKKVTDTYNMPLCLSRWYKHLTIQARQRAASIAADRVLEGITMGSHAAAAASRRTSIASIGEQVQSRRASVSDSRRGSVVVVGGVGGRRG